MAVPVAPAAGEPIAEAWGDVVHDQVVSMDFQAGIATVPANGSFVIATFPRPYAAIPKVVASPNYNGSTGLIAVVQPSGTGLTAVIIYVTTHAGGLPTADVPCTWIAYGPRV